MIFFYQDSEGRSFEIRNFFELDDGTFGDIGGYFES
jgi:hypothetical protein